MDRTEWVEDAESEEDPGEAIDLLADDDSDPESDSLSTGSAEPGSEIVGLPDRCHAALARCERLLPEPRLTLTPRPYQEEALTAWLENGGRGVVVLPTGAGKTLVALMAAAHLKVRPLVVVPTIELLKQWREALEHGLGLPPTSVGQVGGGKRELRAAAVITYDSAWRRPRDLTSFGLIILDEVHHLPSTSYRRIARSSPAPFRLGLTATPERNDLLHSDLDALVGPVVYRRSPADLSRSRHIARFRQERIFVNLTDHEELQYHQLMSRFQWFMARNRLRGQGFEQLVIRAASDPAAREALRCHQRARQVALNAEGKADQVLSLLRRHADDRVLVFCEYTSVVNSLSLRLLLPSVTYRTPAVERRMTLQRFRSGQYTKLITGRVLNEGVDVPDANVAVVVSGSATPREQIQRLGRVLRPKAEEAVLYEIIARGTAEERASKARRVADGERKTVSV